MGTLEEYEIFVAADIGIALANNRIETLDKKDQEMFFDFLESHQERIAYMKNSKIYSNVRCVVTKEITDCVILRMRLIGIDIIDNCLY